LEILDIEGVLILDSKYTRVYGREYTPVPLTIQTFKEGLHTNNDTSIFLTGDSNTLVLYRKINDIFIIFYGNSYCNELFLNSMMNVFVESLTILMKNEVTCTNIDSKYDYLILLIEYFIYDGMFMVDTVEELVKMVPKRNFENIKGMPVPKGFSSIFKKVKFFK
ncbi:vesicle coat complex subunit zeta, partial [Pseudoloma neurophilia]